MADADALATIIRDLLSVPIDEFTAQRNARARELKASGAKELGADVQKLRRPSLPLWAANQLAAHPAVLSSVREATVAARDAQARGATADLREALSRLQRALDEAGRAATDILDASGRRSSGDAGLRVREVVRLAALRDDDWERLVTGALVEEPEPDLGLSVLPAVAPSPSPEPQPAPEERDPLREQRLRKAQHAAAEAGHAADTAERDAQRLRGEADALRERAETAERLAVEAQERAARARQQAADALAAAEAMANEQFRT